MSYDLNTAITASWRCHAFFFLRYSSFFPPLLDSPSISLPVLSLAGLRRRRFTPTTPTNPRVRGDRNIISLTIPTRSAGSFLQYRPSRDPPIISDRFHNVPADHSFLSVSPRKKKLCILFSTTSTSFLLSMPYSRSTLLTDPSAMPHDRMLAVSLRALVLLWLFLFAANRFILPRRVWCRNPFGLYGPCVQDPRG